MGFPLRVKSRFQRKAVSLRMQNLLKRLKQMPNPVGVSEVFTCSIRSIVEAKILTGEIAQKRSGQVRNMMFNTQLTLCGTASGGGYQPVTSPVLFCTVASGTHPEPYQEPLGWAVTFGTLDCMGTILTSIPEPICQIAGHCLSIPSRAVWLLQCIRLVQRWQRRKNS